MEQGEAILCAGELDDSLYLLYRGRVVVKEEGHKVGCSMRHRRSRSCDVLTAGVLSSQASTIYPGAFFNEHVVYASHCEAPYTATAAEDSAMLRLSKQAREDMMWHDARTAFHLILAVFKQVPTHA